MKIYILLSSHAPVISGETLYPSYRQGEYGTIVGGGASNFY